MSSTFYSKLRLSVCISGTLLFALVLLLTSISASGFDLEGQNAPRANAGTNYFGGPLRGWYELEFIPCRVALQPGSNQVVQVNFDHTKNASIVKRGIQNLFTFSPSRNVRMTTPVLTGSNSMEEWYYTFTADVTNNQAGYVYFYARMSGGAHLFGGSSLDLFYAPLQIMKPGPLAGSPDLIVTKTGPSTVSAGNTYSYSITFSNKVSATATAVGVQLSDFLPAGTTYVAGSAVGSSLVTNLTVEANQLYWDIGDMAPGAVGTATYQVKVPFTFANGTVIQNYAQIESAQDDANELDNISIVRTTVLNAPPVAAPDVYAVFANQVLTIGSPGVLANDSDANSFPLNCGLVTNVTAGTLNLSPNGDFVYTPAPDFVGTDTFYYIATNGYFASQPTKVTINVLRLIAPADTNVSCTNLLIAPATNLDQFIAQGGTASGPYCGLPTTVTFIGDTSNGGSGCPSSPLVISRTYMFATGCGDTTNAIQTFTVIDSSIPVITGFPADATYSCANQVPEADNSLVATADNCGGIIVVTHDTDVITAGSCRNRYSIGRTYRVSDSCGNTTTRTQHISVNDQTAPVITVFPVDATYSCADAMPPANDNVVTATDNCNGSVIITHNTDIVASSNCVNRLTISRTYIATDSCGNSTSRTQMITVSGTTSPAITAFPVDATYSCSTSVPPANDSVVTATNACGGSSGLTMTHTADVVTSSNCVNRFTIARTYTVTDVCGNSVAKTQTITVNGTIPPTITSFPADATYSCASSVPGANDNLVSATNACGGNSGIAIAHNVDVITSSNCVNRFTIARTYTVTDACGNSTSKTQTITVNETTPPTITTFPANATYSCGNVVPAANNSLVAAVDNCGGSTVTISHDADLITSSNCVNRFTITRVYRATDACGNATSKTQTITVNGTTPPTITTFPADATYSCAGGVPAPDNSLVSAVDNCGSIAHLLVTHEADLVTSSNCVNRFTITRTYQVSDACGNVTTRSQTITVNSTAVPVITAFPIDASYSCANAVPLANDTLVAASDSCGGNASVRISHDADVITSSNCVNRFTITRTYRATDVCGNATSRSQTIIVNGATPPTITGFPANASYSCPSAVPAADDSLIKAIDNCGGANIAVTHDADLITSSNCVNRFTITRTYRVTDACGNSTSKSQRITVNSTAAPVITGFPPDASYSCANSVPVANNALVSATDNCGGTATILITHSSDAVTSSNCVNRFTISRTYTASDACGNFSSRTQTITVNATTPPTIANFPVDATYSCANAVPPANNNLVTATDGCGATSSL
ncbi:MAG: HYR-like domain-containing protein, partial [Limisphaerales bacterium]